MGAPKKVKNRNKLAVWEEFLHDACIALRQNLCASGVSDEFVGSFNHAVLFTSLIAANFAAGCEFEPLFCTTFGFQFGHLRLLIKNECEHCFKKYKILLHKREIGRHGMPCRTTYKEKTRYRLEWLILQAKNFFFLELKVILKKKCS